LSEYTPWLEGNEHMLPELFDNKSMKEQMIHDLGDDTFEDEKVKKVYKALLEKEPLQNELTDLEKAEMAERVEAQAAEDESEKVYLIVYRNTCLLIFTIILFHVLGESLSP